MHPRHWSGGGRHDEPALGLEQAELADTGLEGAEETDQRRQTDVRHFGVCTPPPKEVVTACILPSSER
jgi:hypothetical protein